MLKKLKKANRGIILAVIVLICFAIWSSVSSQQFKDEETENIEGLISEYFSEASRVSALSGQEHEDNSAAYVQQLMTQEYEKLIDKYWSYSDYIENANKFGMVYYTTKNEMMSESHLFSGMDEASRISSATSEVVVTKVTKNGSEGATAIVDVSITIGPDLTENGGIFISPDGCMHSDGFVNGATYKWQDVEVKFQKIDGEWKIVGLSSFWYDTIAK